MSTHHRLRWAFLAAVLAALSLPARGRAQDPSTFGQAGLEVKSELQGLDRGDGSGSYRLVTTVRDPRADVAIEHELGAERSVEQETTTSESVRVLDGGQERAKAGSDPSALGPWSEPAIAYAIPFDAEFHPEPRKTYRPQGKMVTRIVREVVPDARVSTRSASDGRTTAVVELPDAAPLEQLTESFVAVRQALRHADLGMARLEIRGRTVPPGDTASNQ